MSASPNTPPEADVRQSARRIAHDFNNTLGTIIGNLELIRMDLDPSHPACESVAEIRKAADRARSLVHELFVLTGPPPAADSSAAPPAMSDSSSPGEPDLPRGDGRHILFLDDEEPLVFLATNLFKRLGYRVSGFTDARTACDAFFGNPDQFDLVVTDHNLKNASGVDIAARMLVVRPRMPIILASGELTEALAEQAKDTGIRHVIYKPNTVEGLCRAIHQLAGPR